MTTIFFTIIIFFKLIVYIIIFDIILSWLTLFWVKFRPLFVASIIDPMYSLVKKYIPTSIWPIDFTPIVILIIIQIILWFIPQDIINEYMKITN